MQLLRGEWALEAPDYDPRGRSLHRSVEESGYTVDLLRSPGTLSRHRHRSMEIVIVHSGVVHWRAGDWFDVLVSGDVLILNGNVPHASQPLWGHYTRTILHFLPDAVETSTMLRLPRPERGPLLASLPNGASALFEDIFRLRNQFRRKRCIDPPTKELLTRVVEKVLAARTDPNRSGVHPVLREAVHLMAHSEGEPSTVEGLARHLFVSHGHLCHLFRTHFGCSPNQLWRLIKIERTCQQLYLNRQQTVDELADAAGFDSRRGFERAFQQVMGMSVSVYRRELSKKIQD